MSRNVVRGIGLGLAAGSLWGAAVYRRDLSEAYQRVRSRGTIVLSPYGGIEYTEGALGPAVLVIHGGGGGYDQGELIAQAVLGEQFHWIAPSRFGYLGSSLPAAATWDGQAHAYAYLLDRLGVGKVAVVAMSQGGASALLFALLHPERVSSLTLISCGVAGSEAEAQAEANRKGDMLKLVFQWDLPYWIVSKLFKKQFMALIGASQDVIAELTPGQRVLLGQFVDYMNPASLRAAGAAFDNEAELPGERIAGIKAPTLIVHATDDTLQLYHNAEFAAATIPNARLLRFERGGHLVIGVKQTAIRAAVQEHILEHGGSSAE